LPKRIDQLDISLHHSGSTKNQLRIGTRTKPLEVFQATTTNPERPIREEVLLFYIKQARLRGDDSPVISDMITMVDHSLKHFAANRFRRSLPKERIEEFSESLSEYFWLRMLDPTDAIADQALVSFRSVVVKFGRKVLKKERRQNRCVSLDSDYRGKQAYRLPTPDRFSPPDATLISEVLHLLAPDQERVFTSLHYAGLSVPEIAIAENCSERTVYNRLRSAGNTLRRLLS